MEKIIKCETPADWCRHIGVDSLHPLVTVIDYHRITHYHNPKALCCAFYVVSFYKGQLDCIVKYGRNTYAYQDNTMFCLAPGQVTAYSDEGRIYTPEENNLSLMFHPDYIRDTPLAGLMAGYKFFNYEVHEALRVNDSEVEDVMRCYECIDRELRQCGEAHSREVVCSAIQLLLSYCSRFHDRQYAPLQTQTDTLSRFEMLLNGYFTSGATRGGLPTVRYFAERLNLSPDYLSSLLQKETGRNAQEHIHYRLIEAAKDKLSMTAASVSQVAYELGFEYPQYFSRLFRQKTGMSPREYREQAGKGR